jgi:hypothetical protein
MHTAGPAEVVPAATMDRIATLRPTTLIATSDTVTIPTPRMTRAMLPITGVEKLRLYAKYSTTQTKGITQSLAI